MSESNLTIQIAAPPGEYRENVRTALIKDNYRVICCDDGKKAMECRTCAKPDIIIIDVNIQRIPFLDLAVELREREGEYPVLMALLDEDPERQQYALLAGVDEVIPYPLNELLLIRKIRAVQRIRNQANKESWQYEDAISRLNHLQYEVDMVELVYKYATENQNDQYPGQRCHMSPKAFSNGDIYLVKQTPDGGWKFLFGDFSGHGLYAAMNAWPVGETFHSMAGKGFSIADIADEINNKLVRLLPPQLFLAAFIVEYDPIRHQVSIINAGMPDAVLYSANQQKSQFIPSACHPLGVSKTIDLKNNIQRVTIVDHSYLYLFSDGILESQNWEGDMFGEERLQSIFSRGKSASLYEDVLNHLIEFRGGRPQVDDVSLLEIKLD